MIAFLGTGLLGSNFVRAMRRRGLEVQVWNRSPARARALEADGARAFDDPAAAVAGASRVHVTAVRRRGGRRRAREGAARAGSRRDRHRPHDDLARGSRGAQRTVGGARHRVPARPGLHGAAERARGDRHHARVGRSRALRRALARAREDDGQARVPRPAARSRRGVQAVRQPVPDVDDGRHRRRADARKGARRPCAPRPRRCSTSSTLERRWAHA